MINDLFVARLFCAENQGSQPEDLLMSVRKWIAGKIVAAKVSHAQTRRAGFANSVNVDWAAALRRASYITFAVREVLGLPEEQQTEVANMTMAEYSAARKDLGMRNIMTALPERY